MGIAIITLFLFAIDLTFFVATGNPLIAGAAAVLFGLFLMELVEVVKATIKDVAKSINHEKEKVNV